MSKRLLISMPDGTVWQVPLEMIASAKASQFFTDEFVNGIVTDESISAVDRLTKLTQLMDEMFKKELLDEEALIAWAKDKVEWADVVRFATIFSTPDTSESYSSGWKTGEMKTIEVDDELEKQAMNGVL